MLKFLSVLMCVLAVSHYAKAMDVEIVRNTDAKGDGKAYIVNFDGESEVGASLLKKMLSCYYMFSVDDERSLLNLYAATITELDNNLKTLSSDPTQNGYLTMTEREKTRYSSFVLGNLKTCLSKDFSL